MQQRRTQWLAAGTFLYAWLTAAVIATALVTPISAPPDGTKSERSAATRGLIKINRADPERRLATELIPEGGQDVARASTINPDRR